MDKEGRHSHERHSHRQRLSDSNGLRVDSSRDTSPPGSFSRAAFPLSQMDWPRFRAAMERTEIRCVWVGHATCLVRVGEVTFMTDPVFSQRCSPVQFSGPKRAVPPPFEICDPQFTKLDFVVISHCHYDHLDYHSVLQLHKKFGRELVWYVPLRLKSWFTKRGILNVSEMDWWQTSTLKDTSITFLPAQHWTNRWGVLDIRRTLWGGWLVETRSPTLKVWFAGDTGYCSLFKEIGKRHGPLDLSLIPTGAYYPPVLLKPQHTNPEEAIQIHKEVQSRQSMAIHCCTFCLTLEDLDEPPRRSQTAMKAEGLDETEFLTICHGEMIQIRQQKLISLPKTLPVD